LLAGDFLVAVANLDLGGAGFASCRDIRLGLIVARGVGQILDGEAREHRRLDVAELALFGLPFAIVVLDEHPDHAHQHRDARHPENDVQDLLIAVGLVGGGHKKVSNYSCRTGLQPVLPGRTGCKPVLQDRSRC
jgi:hypothetical protein